MPFGKNDPFLCWRAQSSAISISGPTYKKYPYPIALATVYLNAYRYTLLVMSNSPLTNRRILIFLFIWLALFIVLLFQYLHNRSLWIDEAMLALNIINRSPAELLRPLDDAQVAPILFLFVEKLFVSVFGTSEFSLRLFALLCATLSLPLFYLLCRYLSDSRVFALCAMILLGLTPSFVYYSSEVKQYMADLTALLVLYCAAILPMPWLAARRGLILSIAGAICIFLSNVSVVPMAVVGGFILWQIWKTKRVQANQWVPLAVWLTAFLVNFFVFIYQHPSTIFMKNYWMRSFVPSNPFSVDFRKFVNRAIAQIFQELVPSLPGGYLFLVSVLLYACGLIFLLRKKNFLALYLCLAPLAIHLAMSALQLYPFELRMLLYEAPLFVFVMMYGIWNLVAAVAPRPQARLAILAPVLALLSFGVFLNYPRDHDEVKPAIRYLNKAAKPGETLYICWGGAPATQYYLDEGLTRFDSLHVVWGTAKTSDGDFYLTQLLPVKGKTWVLTSHRFSFYGKLIDVGQVVRNLSKRGQLLSQVDFKGASLYLFDLQ